jgi:hypothetical protein
MDAMEARTTDLSAMISTFHQPTVQRPQGAGASNLSLSEASLNMKHWSDGLLEGGPRLNAEVGHKAGHPASFPPPTAALLRIIDELEGAGTDGDAGTMTRLSIASPEGRRLAVVLANAAAGAAATAASSAEAIARVGVDVGGGAGAAASVISHKGETAEDIDSITSHIFWAATILQKLSGWQAACAAPVAGAPPGWLTAAGPALEHLSAAVGRCCPPGPGVPLLQRPSEQLAADRVRAPPDWKAPAARTPRHARPLHGAGRMHA